MAFEIHGSCWLQLLGSFSRIALIANTPQCSAACAVITLGLEMSIHEMLSFPDSPMQLSRFLAESNTLLTEQAEFSFFATDLQRIYIARQNEKRLKSNIQQTVEWWIDQHHRSHPQRLLSSLLGLFCWMEVSGLEPLTSCLQSRRSTN